MNPTLVLLTSTAIAVMLTRPQPAVGVCADSVAVDTATAKAADFVNLGEAVGQTFVAADTLVSSITFYRPAIIDTSFTGFHLYIVETDSTGKPRPGSLVLNGPTVYNFYGDGKHLVPFRFDFDPPVALPHAGVFEAAVQAEPCGGALQFSYAVTDQYSGGAIWFHSRTNPCSLRTGPSSSPSQDMIFSITFCGPSVPSRVDTWGFLKVRYRE